jgi:hypothetical protein
VSLSSADGKINLLRKMIGTGDFGVHASLPNGYDDIITMNIFPSAGTTLTSSSWISLQVSAIQTDQNGISTLSLLGAQNIFFNAAFTRNLRLVSPNAVTLRQAKALKSKTSSVDAAADVGDFSATGWWFRDSLGDTNSFPRVGVFSHSPGMCLWRAFGVILTVASKISKERAASLIQTLSLTLAARLLRTSTIWTTTKLSSLTANPISSTLEEIALWATTRSIHGSMLSLAVFFWRLRLMLPNGLSTITTAMAILRGPCALLPLPLITASMSSRIHSIF